MNNRFIKLAVNHDPNAIASHAYNHPEAIHYIEDIRTLNLTPLVVYVDAMRKNIRLQSLYFGLLWSVPIILKLKEECLVILIAEH